MFVKDSNIRVPAGSSPEIRHIGVELKFTFLILGGLDRGNPMSELDEAVVNVGPDLRINYDPDAYGCELAFDGQMNKLMLGDFDRLEQIKLVLIVYCSRRDTSDHIFKGLHLHLDCGSSPSFTRVVLYGFRVTGGQNDRRKVSEGILEPISNKKQKHKDPHTICYV